MSFVHLTLASGGTVSVRASVIVSVADHALGSAIMARGFAPEIVSESREEVLRKIAEAERVVPLPEETA